MDDRGTGAASHIYISYLLFGKFLAFYKSNEVNDFAADECVITHGEAFTLA